MRILEKLGLDQKKKKGAPVIGEKKKKQEQTSTLNHNVYIRALILVGFLGILIASVPRSTFNEPVNYAIGEPWRADDLTAPFTFSLQKTSEEIDAEQESIRENTLPVFEVETDAEAEIQTDLDSLFSRMEPVLEAYHQWQLAQTEGGEEAAEDSLNFSRQKDSANISLSDQSWDLLLEQYHRVQAGEDFPETRTAPPDRFIGESLKNSLEGLIGEVLSQGVIDQPRDDLANDEITVRNLIERTDRTYNTGNVRDMEEAVEFVQYRLSREYYDDVARAGTELFEMVFEPNFVYNESATQERVEERLSEISTTKGAVSQGQVIIRRGDLVTDERYNILQSLAEARSQNATDYERMLRYAGDIFVIIAITTVFFFYLYLYRRPIFENNAMLLLVFIALSIVCVASAFTYGLEDISPYVVPVAVAPIILTIIFDSRVGLLSTITLALLTGLIYANNYEYVVATTVACSLGLFSVRDIKKRSQFFFTTPGIVFGSYVFIIVGFNLNSFGGWSGLLNDILLVGINAVFILFTYPLILLFEKLFKVTTDFTLLELSDTNLPLLKEMMTSAPGTFHHSLQVANLAEAAAGAIGANALLCRVGGLYHDIGKMENPGYFTENQAGPNEHDKLKPRMSALVIKAHVSNGVKIANEHNLPEVIIDFIKSHHGTSLIKYFYEKAKERTDSDKDEIRNEDYRYDGPLPRTKEEGIMLLADGVEAASRAMKDPSYQKLENLIDKMIDDRVQDGQLSRCPLTFQDLRVIKESFMKILVGIYHSRVEYPEDKKEEFKKAKTEEPHGPYVDSSSGKEIPAPPAPPDDYINT